MANIPYVYRIYGVFFNKCDKTSYRSSELVLASAWLIAVASDIDAAKSDAEDRPC